MNVKKLEQLDILLVKDLYQLGEGRVRNNECGGVGVCVGVALGAFWDHGSP